MPASSQHIEDMPADISNNALEAMRISNMLEHIFLITLDKGIVLN